MEEETKALSADEPPTGPVQRTVSGVLTLTAPEARAPDPALQVFEYWVKVMGKPASRTRFDKKRRTAVERQLAAGLTVADLCKAIDGCKRDPFSMGENNRGKKYDDLELICRNATKVEEFMGYVDEPPPAVSKNGAERLRLAPALKTEASGRKYL